MTAEKVLVQVEDLTTELYGQGAAVSIDEEDDGVYIRCWNRKGLKVNEVLRLSKTSALKAMASSLRLLLARKEEEMEQ